MNFLAKITICSLILFTSSANAALLTPTSLTSTVGIFNDSKAADSVIPNEGGNWQANTAFWYGTTPSLTLGFSEIFEIEDILVSVDNNDSYQIDYSTDGSSWATLLNISSSYGEVSNGMDTMSSLSGHSEYISGIDFSPVLAQYLRISATGGDNSYSVGELQAFGSNVSAVPIPAAVLMFAPALLGFFGLRRKANNTLS